MPNEITPVKGQGAENSVGPTPRRRVGIWPVLGFLIVMACLSGWFGLTPSLGHLRTGAVRHTHLMDLRRQDADLAGRKYVPRQQWLPLNLIDRDLREAVLATEDDDFYLHHGIDWDETLECFQMVWARKKIVRGGSTITQQVAKNLFLDPDRSWMRKAKEALIALRLERTLSKDRILEIYLNIAEWGPGIFGAEAAAQRYFKKSAADLTLEEALALTAVLPSPLKHSPQREDGFLRRRKAAVRKRLWARLHPPGWAVEHGNPVVHGAASPAEAPAFQQTLPGSPGALTAADLEGPLGLDSDLAGDSENSDDGRTAPAISLRPDIFEKHSENVETPDPKPVSN